MHRSTKIEAEGHKQVLWRSRSKFTKAHVTSTGDKAHLLVTGVHVLTASAYRELFLMFSLLNTWDNIVQVCHH